MIGRILRIAFLAALVALVANRLLNRRQKRSLHEIVQISAWVFLAAALAVLGWHVLGLG